MGEWRWTGWAEETVMSGQFLTWCSQSTPQWACVCFCTWRQCGWNITVTFYLGELQWTLVVALGDLSLLSFFSLAFFTAMCLTHELMCFFQHVADSLPWCCDIPSDISRGSPYFLPFFFPTSDRDFQSCLVNIIQDHRFCAQGEKVWVLFYLLSYFFSLVEGKRDECSFFFCFFPHNYVFHCGFKLGNKQVL